MVDCFKVCEDIKMCLVELFEMVLDLFGLIVVIVDMDDFNVEELIFFFFFVCLYCGYLLYELEFCLFLFNNFVGVCLICDGLGVE